MDKQWMTFHLAEASEAIDELIAKLSSDVEYDYPEVLFDFQHVYTHVNSAWNARNGDTDNPPFNVARQFPTDIDLSTPVE